MTKNVYDDWQLEKLREVEPFDLAVKEQFVICDQCIVGYNIVFVYDSTREGFQREYQAWEARGYERDPNYQVPRVKGIHDEQK